MSNLKYTAPTPAEIVKLLEDSGVADNVDMATRIKNFGIDGAPYVGAINALNEVDEHYLNNPRLEEVRQLHMADGNCSWASIFIDFIDGLLEQVYNDDIVRRWISVAEELPKVETPVLVCVKGLDYPVVAELCLETCNPFTEPYFKDFYYWTQLPNDSREINEDVYAWMPLYRIVNLK